MHKVTGHKDPWTIGLLFLHLACAAGRRLFFMHALGHFSHHVYYSMFLMHFYLIIEIRGFDDEEEVQVYASQATFNDTFGAIKVVIVFTGGISESSNYSPKISYKIRMVNNEWGLPSTERLYDMFQLAGPVDGK